MGTFDPNLKHEHLSIIWGKIFGMGKYSTYIRSKPSILKITDCFAIQMEFIERPI